jgi:dienelactone hydrolase
MSVRVPAAPSVIYLALIGAFLAAEPARAQPSGENPSLIPPAPLHEQVLHLQGDPDRPTYLVVTLYTPPGAGPFPLAVMNHGANGGKEAPAATPRYRYSYAAYYFLSRGYAVAMPMMRGYGQSGGSQVIVGCELSDMAIYNGRDIAGVIDGLAANRHIDVTRVVVAGQSFGGWNALGLGTVAPAGVQGLVDFFGGVRSSGCTATNGGPRDALVASARRLGANTSVPALWFVGENDSLFDSDLLHDMFAAYTRAGGQAQLVDIGRFMDDSHQMLSHLESIPLWAPRLDAFLARIGLPSRAVYPAYLPTPWPAATHFAAIDDIAAVPWVNASSRENYRAFLALKVPRVFLVAPGGQSATAQGGFDPLARGLAACRARNLDCRPYATDGDVVWVPPGR